MLSAGPIGGGPCHPPMLDAGTSLGPRTSDSSFHLFDVLRERTDGSEERGPRSYQPIDSRLGAQQRCVASGVPTQRRRDGQIEHHLGRIMPGQGDVLRSQRLAQSAIQTRGHQRPREKHTARLTHRRNPGTIRSNPRIQPATLVHLGSTFLNCLTPTSTIHIFPGQRHFTPSHPETPP